MEYLLAWLVVGAIAGFLAGVIVKGYGFGLVGNIIVGIIGALIAGWLFSPGGIYPMYDLFGGDWIGAIIWSTIGAVILLLIIGLVRRTA